ncbi:GAF domain-containing sensor histidine kinase [Gloeocapsa sp. PCC 73106]|uniref:sensor histidine kinase n=1 Tax=Gloeocapsa sp. PCC 73106 TaxID=102232 RepID=UPI0002AC0FB9|nr:GAF domain-containing sensor histidine kinase [Gloeocapsa sp. PCC 73106]ELR98305.1 signal transduction histidine kinase [Gloeocapsa sp. PCC 73106]
MNCQESSKLINWDCLGAELVYTQDKSGKYLSFYWQKAKDYDLVIQEIPGNDCGDIFTPVALEAYLEKLKRVIERKIPEQCQWQFKCGQSFCFFQLVITPVLGSSGDGEIALIMGYLVEEQVTLTTYSLIPISPEPYQKMLNQIVSKIRKTLSLETIWQETVNNLGEYLKVSRCLLIYCNVQNQQLEVKAEYCQEPFKSILGQRFNLDSQPYWKQAISSKEPVIIEEIDNNLYEERSVLILSTFYQDQRNGIICLQQCDYCRHWSQIEIDLLHKLADQVGTAIAHATLYNQLKKVSQYKSEFLANTSHELRTPLHAIINFLNLILDGVVTEPEEQKEFLVQVYQSSIHLLKLIDDLLDIAKIESGKMELEFKTASLCEVLQNIEKLARPQAEKKNLHFKIKYPSTYEEVVLYTNYQRLLQVMLNLVNNAIKFTHEGGVFIIAEIISKKIDFQGYRFPGVVKISVADTGIGVPLNKQDELFEHFFQVDSSRTRSYQGTGLGLAISKTLIEAMGGTISFYSMGEGLGSTVTFTIPLNHLPLLKTIEELPHE